MRVRRNYTAEEENKELCKVGDVLYKMKNDGTIYPVTIIEIVHLPHTVYRDNFGNSYFNYSLFISCAKSMEEARAKIERKLLISQKRQLLKTYEEELNERFGLKDHWIVK